MAQEKETEKKKDDAFWKVLSAALELDVKKGHLKWTLSDVARRSGITRSLIYYYFGRSKAGILNEAVKMIGFEVIGLGKDRMKLWEEGAFTTSMIEARKLYTRLPYLGSFVLEHRSRENDIGEELRSIEKKFERKIQKFFPHLNRVEVRGVWAAYYGLIQAPEVDEEVIEVSVKMLLRGVLSAKNKRAKAQ